MSFDGNFDLKNHPMAEHSNNPAMEGFLFLPIQI